MEKRRRRVLLSMGTAGLATLAGCNTSSDDGATATETTTQEPTDSPTTGETSTDRSTTTTATPTRSVPSQKFAPEDGNPGDFFGTSLAVSTDGTMAIVGANNDDNENGPEAGAVYVFKATSDGWRQQTKLTAPDGDRKDLFGLSVDLSADGTTAIIGSMTDRNPEREVSGAAYVFSRTDGGWSRGTKLVGADRDNKDYFGSDVALSGDGTTALVGARGEDVANGPEAGAAYVFSRADGEWRRQTMLVPDDGQTSDEFGWKVALSADGTTAIVASHFDTNANGDVAGSLYVFGSTGEGWTQETKLIADDGDSGVKLGKELSISGDGQTILAGTYRDNDPYGRYCGSAYLFTNNDDSWSQEAKIVAEDGDEGDYFGMGTGITSDGTRAIVGAYADEEPNGMLSGSAYVFDKTDRGWKQTLKLAAPDGDRLDRFGRATEIAGGGTKAFVGAYKDDDPNGKWAGSAYVFSLE